MLILFCELFGKSDMLALYQHATNTIIKRYQQALPIISRQSSCGILDRS